ncbi:MAG: DegT/DnrJ/EryC1/StrS family aminotransferase [Bryobacteraceae bacterium]
MIAMRTQFLPYSLPSLGEEEIAEVADSIRSGWVTTGPKVKLFEQEFARYVGAEHAIAVSSCTAALHLTLAAHGIGPGDEVIVPTLTFCSTANVVVHLGAKPVLVDVTQDGQMSVDALRAAVTPRTRAILPVHYGGQACPLEEISAIASLHGIPVIEDAAHAVGTTYQDRRIGTHGRATCFSFYATKNMTTGEGGMITTNDADLAGRIRLLSLHGMSRDAWKRYTQAGNWWYEVVEPGYKSNMSDLQAAMGIHQLRKLDGFIRRRRDIAARYQEAFADLPELRLPHDCPRRPHAYHLFPVRLVAGELSITRDQLIDELRLLNIGTSVHFIPLHRHPYYQATFGYNPEQFPGAECFFEGLLSLPLYPKMSNSDVEDVISALRAVVLTGREEANPKGLVECEV